jgi:hypothetical protein
MEELLREFNASHRAGPPANSNMTYLVWNDFEVSLTKWSPTVPLFTRTLHFVSAPTKGRSLPPDRLPIMHGPNGCVAVGTSECASRLRALGEKWAAGRETLTPPRTELTSGRPA